MLNARRSTVLRRELTAAERIPYNAHVAPRVIRTEFGDYLQALAKHDDDAFAAARRQAADIGRIVGKNPIA
jgi:hypothetical protein